MSRTNAINSSQVFLALTLCVVATTPAFADGTPRIVFGQTVCDLGKAKEGDFLTNKFSFHNAGDAVLEIQKLDFARACITASVKSAKLQPGEKGEITFTLDLNNIRGPAERNITVLSNDPKTSTVQVTIKVAVTPLYEFEPPVIYFGEVQPGIPMNGTIHVKRLDGKKLNITKVLTDRDYITVKIKPVDDSGGQAARLEVEAKPVGKPGMFSDLVRVHVDDSVKPVLLFPVAGQLFGGINVEPASLVWSVPDVDQWPGPNPEATTIRRLIVTSTLPDQSFELREFASTFEDLLMQVNTVEKGKKYEVLLKLDQPLKASEKGVLTFETSLATHPTVVVPIEITVARQ